ncbi:hypothetical protein [Rugamonas rubra]|jgi:hypothetical protein|uniref:Uncharacterized protein n=1 Tax=Rugamonas rubra TaxID=758825 RepID=A0A1I4M550_9BURK|nr:hypothetical protein [Rugamonas rubra]SFL98290.1 hypothetical protein SAMN02982985_02247 [Rugamonas rubra]
MGTKVSGAAGSGANTAVDDIEETNKQSEKVDAANTKAKFEKKGRDDAMQLI